MNANNFEWAAGQLRSIVIDHESRLSESDVANVWEFIDVGELGLAFETLCTQLAEHGVVVSSHVRDVLADLGAYFELDSQVWKQLER